jgi:hypothetical protein
LKRKEKPFAPSPSINKCVVGAFLASFFFVLAGQPFIPRLGIENDEALFAGPLYEPLQALYAWPWLHHRQIPLMLMSYLGCLKTLIYIPVFKLFGTGVYALREPALIFGAVSVWLFFLLLRRIAGDRAAMIGCWLLATDSLYLLTTCYDWGPVALQHLLIVGGALLLLRFYQTLSSISLALGWLLWGLALWDKALALWMLSGLGIAGILSFPRQIFAVTDFRRILISAGALALGAAPLIGFNVENRLATLRENTGWDTRGVRTKMHIALETVRGGALLGWLNASDQDTPVPHRPTGAVEKLSAGISSSVDERPANWTLIALIAALILAPFAGLRALRAVIFFSIALAVAWAQMAISPHAGGSVHHTILLWPWPIAIIAISFAGVSQRLGRFGVPAVAAATALIAIGSLLLTNEYYVKLVRNGGAPVWSAAVFPLAVSLKNSDAAHVFCTDWGILQTLILLDKNKPVVRDGMGPAIDDAAGLKWILSDPSNIVVGHLKGSEVVPGMNEKLVEAAAKLGRQPQQIRVISDEYGRNVFTVYRFP